jgi:Type II secretion system (T2SS), protein E, N-terminal domain
MQQEMSARPYTEEGFLDYLDQNNLMDSIACKRVAVAMEGSGQPVDTTLLELGLLEEHKLADALASYMDLERITGTQLNQLPALEVNVPQSFLRRSFILPIFWGANSSLKLLSRANSKNNWLIFMPKMRKDPLILDRPILPVAMSSACVILPVKHLLFVCLID